MPGELKIQNGNPPRPGLYVAYIEADYVELRYAEKILLFYGSDNRWGYPSSDQYFRGVVYGWIGPLPAMLFE